MSSQSKIGLTLLLTLAFFQFQAFGDELTTLSSKNTPDSSVYYSSWCPIEIDFSLALDQFRSLPEGSFEGNWGAFTQLNLKAPLPRSFSIQLAGSYGLYDWYGRSSTPVQQSGGLQQQGFITVAASRQTEARSGLNVGFAYDCMLNKNFGLFAVNPIFYQIRGQMGYLIKESNELGLWSSYGINIAHQKSGQIPLQFRAISQVNLFWCHYYKNHGYTMIWAGTPYRRGLMYKSGRPGTFTMGAQFSIPMTSYLSLQGTAGYMGARKVAGIRSSSNYAADIAIGLTYSFGKRRIVQSPYMTPANNTNFMADTNQNF